MMVNSRSLSRASPLPQGVVSICREALQPDERAGSEQFREAAAVGQTQLRRCQLRQWIQHKGPFLHMVVRDFEARFVDQSVAEQQDIQIQRAWPPAFKTLAALLVLDGL
ncbi:hypothetical protein D3C76_1508060 [compost metagenome]